MFPGWVVFFLPLFLWLHLVAEKQRMMGNEALDICCLGSCVLMWEDSLINVSLERFSVRLSGNHIMYLF